MKHSYGLINSDKLFGPTSWNIGSLEHAIQLDVEDYDYLISEKLKVEPLRSVDIVNAAETLILAQVGDPIAEYAYKTLDARDTPLARRARKLQAALAARWSAHRKTGFTVNHGHSVVLAGNLDKSRKPNKPDKVLGLLLGVVSRALARIANSSEQRKRLKEVDRKLEQLVKDTLGDRAEDMLVVDALATHPAYRRRGYGGALVDFVTHSADMQGRSTYLLSSNPINTEFYNSLGFFEVSVTMIGDDNPAWNKQPLPIPLMVREYKGTSEGMNEKL